MLPSSKKQSKMKGSYQEFSDERFAQLYPKAKELMRCFNVKEEFLPLFLRYKNKFWDSLEYWVLPPPVQARIKDRSVVLSPLFGFASVESPMPEYVLDWKSICQGKTLKEYWKEDIKRLSRELFEGKTVFLFVGKQEESLLDLSTASQIVAFEYYRAKQKVKNPLPHRAYTLRYIAERDLSLDELFKINFYDYRVEKVERKGKRLKVLLRSEGRYI
ncbi:MAG: hypothetical protein ACPLRS_04230 [Hydrogenobacter sp.]